MHKARTKSAAEPDYQKLNCEKITKQDETKPWINKQDYKYETKTRRV